MKNKTKSNADANADAEEIPMATVVEVLGEVESNPLPPANNPQYRTGETHSSITSVSTQSNLEVSPGTSDTRVARATKTRVRLPKNLGRRPYGIQCPHCHRETITVLEDRIGMGTILATVILAIIFWPICWLPFCMPSCKRTYHYCGHDSCRKKIGVTQVCA